MNKTTTHQLNFSLVPITNINRKRSYSQSYYYIVTSNQCNEDILSIIRQNLVNLSTFKTKAELKDLIVSVYRSHGKHIEEQDIVMYRDLDFKYDLIFKDTDPIGLCNCEIKLSY